MTLGERLSQTASAHPRRVAVVFEGRRYRYKEINDMAGALATGLASLGLKPGCTAAILLPNCPEFPVAFFGIVKAGAAAVPLNTFLTATEIDYILEDSGAEALIYDPAFKDRVSELKHAPKLLISVGEASDGAVSFRELIDKHRGINISPSPPSPPVKGGEINGPGGTPRNDDHSGSRDDEPAAIFYTSGTTGYPKGAVLTHGNLLSDADACTAMFKLTRKDRFLLFLPMFHSFSFLVCLLLPFTLGARVIVLPFVKPFSKVVKAVVFGRATFFVAIPAVYNLLSMKKFPKLILRLLALRLCVSGAAPLSRETLDRFAVNYPFPLIEGYGLTEASPVVSCNPIDRERKPGSAGLPLPGVQVRAVDEDGRPLPSGSVGELTVKGPNVMKGYHGNEDATREAIVDGWLHTGDMGYLDEDGYIFIVDRKKDLILVHGMNVYPREVEEALYKHPAVKDAAVIGVTDPHHGEVPKAFITVMEGASPTEKDIKEYLRGRLASYKVPRQVEFVDSLPMTPTGKVLKRRLKEN